MSRKLYPHNRVKYWYTYDVDDICALFATKGLHVQTVRKWIKDGLKTIDNGKPALIYGHDLIDYLKKHNAKNKCVTKFSEIFCMKCKDARPIFQKRIAIKQHTNILKVQGACRMCKTRMFQNYSLSDFKHLQKTFSVVGVSELYDCKVPSDKTHIHVLKHHPVNESGQEALF